MKPTIDEQIEWQKQLLRNYPQAEFEGNAILKSLERLKQIDAQEPKDGQPVPVEPEIVGWLEHHKAGDNIGWEQVDHPYAKADALIKKSDYDTLQSSLQRVTEHAQRNGRLAQQNYEAMKAAESLNKRLAELLRNPSPELLKNCGRRLLRFQDDSTDESFSALQWAEVKQDAARVLAELSAELLKEVK